MDYTLAQYRPETFEALAHQEAVKKLVDRFNYPKVRTAVAAVVAAVVAAAAFKGTGGTGGRGTARCAQCCHGAGGSAGGGRWMRLAAAGTDAHRMPQGCCACGLLCQAAAYTLWRGAAGGRQRPAPCLQQGCSGWAAAAAVHLHGNGWQASHRVGAGMEATDGHRPSTGVGLAAAEYKQLVRVSVLGGRRRGPPLGGGGGADGGGTCRQRFFGLVLALRNGH